MAGFDPANTRYLPTASPVDAQFTRNPPVDQPDIDGALVGGASLDPRAFAEIVQNTCKLLD
jgi:hypothetical protein